MFEKISSVEALPKLTMMMMILWFGTQISAYILFFEDGSRVATMDIQGGMLTFGWMFQVLALVLASATLFLSLKIKE